LTDTGAQWAIVRGYCTFMCGLPRQHAFPSFHCLFLRACVPHLPPPSSQLYFYQPTSCFSSYQPATSHLSRKIYKKLPPVLSLVELQFYRVL
jgi:hypothetical protein